MGEEYRVIEEGQNGRTIVVSKDLPDWYRQLADMYHCEYMDAAEHAVVSDKDDCHMDAENQRKLGKAVYERIKGLIQGKATKVKHTVICVDCRGQKGGYYW